MPEPSGPAPDRRREILTAVKRLGHGWHAAGSLPDAALDYFVRITPPGGFKNSLETGCGRSTVLLSHLSRRHTVFTFVNPDEVDNSYARVKASPELNPDTTRFVLGPTQQTLPAFAFEGPYDFAMLDGPHAYPFPELEYYFVYPHLAAGTTLVVDDIHIPTVYNLFCFLREDAMFRLGEVIETTAFFTRTDAPAFHPYGDGWTEQGFNAARFPAYPPPDPPAPPPVRGGRLRQGLARVLPRPVKTAVKKLFLRPS